MWTLVAAVAVAVAATASAASVPVVSTAAGAVRGTEGRLQTLAYLGIPFGEAPVGALRFQAPVAKAAWDGVLNATEFGPGCLQTCKGHLPAATCPREISEDCLSLNVWTPDVTGSLPVMLFIPGGGFMSGAGGVDMYDGGALAAQGVVVVTMNYRLGALGWLFDPERGLPGNQGLRDQLLAMHWVQDNIQQFGGQPKNVTLFGESAGGMSVTTHLMMDASDALFQRAIVESTVPPVPYATSTQGAATAAYFCKKAGCDDTCDASCLQSMSVNTYTSANSDTISHISFGGIFEPLTDLLTFVPAVDGDLIKQRLIPAYQQSKAFQLGKSVVIGTNAQEAVLLIDDAVGKLLAVEYEAGVADEFHLRSHEVLERYPSTGLLSTDDNRPVLARLLTDYLFYCPARNLTRIMQAANDEANTGAQMWMYRFSFVPSHASAVFGPKFAYCDDVVCHGAELPFVFDSLGLLLNGTEQSASEKAVAQFVSTHWATFAKTGMPSTSGFFWPALESTPYETINVTATPPPPIVDDLQDSICDFWDSMGYTRGTA